MSELFDKQVYPDRPWNGRGYGRIRLDESLARDLSGIMYEVVRERFAELRQAKQEGRDAIVEKSSLKRAMKIKERITNLIKEQGWEDDLSQEDEIR